MSSILVTGAAGFIGSHFVESLLHDNQEPKNLSFEKVISYDILSYAGHLKNLEKCEANKKHLFVKGNICDQEKVNQLIREYSISTIVNFAAETHVDRSLYESENFVSTNIGGTHSLLESCRKFQCRFIQISTDEVYGPLKKDSLASTENSPIRCSSPYSASKASADLLTLSYVTSFGINAVITRCCNNFGPRQNSEKFIPKTIENWKLGKSTPLYGDGKNRRQWIDVRDHCLGIKKLLAKIDRVENGSIFHFGSQFEVSNLELIEALARFYPEAPSEKYQFVSDRPGHDWRYCLNDQKTKQILDWRNIYTVEDSIKNILENS